MIVVATFREIDIPSGNESFIDTYTKVDTIEEAKRVYQQNLEDETLYSSTICGVIESTDYEPTLATSRINFKKLRVQKEILSNVIMSEGEADDPQQRKDAKKLDGLINLLDSIQDEAVGFGWTTEGEAFNLNKD